MPERNSSPAQISRGLNLPNPLGRRAVVIGAGSFGTAVAVLLARGGFRTILQTRSDEQAAALIESGENKQYLPGVKLPGNLRIESVRAGVGKAEFVFLGVPSSSLNEVVTLLDQRGLDKRAKVISLCKGLVPPYGTPPTSLLSSHFGTHRVACIGGPAHAHEMVTQGAGLVAASHDEELAATIAAVLLRAGVVCEHTNDPTGVELSGAAKNAAAVAAGATEAQGLNAAGAAAGHIFAEAWRLAELLGAQPATFIGLAGTGDLVATALAPQSRNRRAGELLAQGVPLDEIPERIGQAVEALESVPLLAAALERHGIAAPVTGGLVRLITGTMPLEDWVSLVRTTVPPPPRWSMRQRGAARKERWFDRFRKDRRAAEKQAAAELDQQSTAPAAPAAQAETSADAQAPTERDSSGDPPREETPPQSTNSDEPREQVLAEELDDTAPPPSDGESGEAATTEPQPAEKLG